MKIRTDVHEYGSGRPLVRRPERVMSAESTQSGVDVPHVRGEVQIRSNLEQEKILSEALAIVQMSQSLIQRALEISGRLRAIASRAMATGSIDTEELSLAVSDANSSFAAQGEGIPAPVAAIPSFETHPAPEIRELLQTGMDMGTGIIPDKEQFDNIDRALMKKNNASRAEQDEVIRSLGVLQMSGQWYDENRVREAMSDTSRRIMENPFEGLKSHNRVRPESVIRLVG